MLNPTVAADPHSISQGAIQAISDLVFGAPTGDAVTITSAGSNIPRLKDKEFFEIRNHPDTTNNGLYQVNDATPAAGTVDVRKVSGADPVQDAVGRNVDILCTFETAVADGVWANADGDNIDITSAGGNLPSMEIGERFEVRNHTNADNNGVYEVLSTVTNGFTNKKLTGNAPANAASEAVDVDTEQKSIFFDTAALGLWVLEQPGVILTNVTDAAWSGASGARVTIASAGGNLPVAKIGQKILVAAHSNATNNGYYVIRRIPTVQGEWLADMVSDGAAPANAVAEAVDMRTDPWVDDTGILGQPLYSRNQLYWQTDNFLRDNAAFPMFNIDSDAGKYLIGQNASGNNTGWNFVDNAEFGVRTRKLVRNMAWQEYDSAGVITAEYAALRGNASVEDPDRDLPYYLPGTDTTVDNTVDLEFAGPPDEAILVLDATVTRAQVTPNGYDFNDAGDTIDRNDGGDFVADGYVVGGRVIVSNATVADDNGSYVITAATAAQLTVENIDGSAVTFSNTTDDNTATMAVDNRFAFSLRLRPRDDDAFGKTFAQAGLADALAANLSNRAFVFPVGCVEDQNITNDDATVAGYGVTLTFFDTPQARGGSTLVGGSRNFGIIVDGNNRRTTEIYEAIQFLLRSTGDIDNDGDTHIGRAIDGLVRFNGNILEFGSVDGGLSFPTNPDGGGNGMYADNVASEDANFVAFFDNLGVLRRNLETISVTLDFNQVLIDDLVAVGDLYFDYTIQDTVADLAINAGSPATFTSAGANLPALDVGANAYVRISGLTGDDAAMNGVYQVTAETSASSWDVVRYDGAAIVSVGATSVTLDQHPYDTPDAIIVDTNNRISGTTISFTNPDTIGDTGNGFGIFSVGDRLRIEGAGAGTNAGKIVKVATVLAGTITIEQDQFQPVLDTQAAGGSVTITQIASVEADADFGFNFDFDGNQQGGRPISTTTAVRAKAIGLQTAQYTESAVLLIQSGTPLTVPLQSQQERNVIGV